MLRSIPVVFHRALFAFLLLVMLPFSVMASTAGSMDTAFNSGNGAGGNVNPFVYALAVQPDGKTVMGGNFTTVNGIARSRIARLNADGSLDTSFDPGSGANAVVETLIVQADGKVVMSGYFTAVNGVARNRIARLNTDGSLDASFNPGVGANASVEAFALQTDGKIVIVGNFTTIDGFLRYRIARLNVDGSVDVGFNAVGTGANDVVRTVGVQTDGKVLIGGQFDKINGVSRNGFARLHADGTLDTTFNTGSGADNAVFALAIQSDGKVVLGGGFNLVNGVSRKCIARVNHDGSLDTTFAPGTGANNTVLALVLQADGKVVMGGHFTTINGVAKNYLSRINSNGSIDTAFDIGSGASSGVDSLAIQQDGKLLAGGRFTLYSGTAINYIARIHTGDADGDSVEDAADNFFSNAVAAQDADLDGFADQWLQPASFGCAENSESCNGLVLDDVVDAPDFDGLLGAGDNCPFIFNTDQLDTDSDNAGNVCDMDDDNDNVLDRADNCMLVSNVSQQDADSDGVGDVCDATPLVAPVASRDISFNPPNGASDIVYTLGVQPGGKVVAGGNFTVIAGVARNRIAQLNGGGSLDTDFNPGTGTDTAIEAMAVQSDGKVLIGGGWITTVNGVARNRIARLNSNGSLDTSFNVGNGASSGVYALAVQPDGKILAGGNFTTINSVARNRIARLNTNGSVDTAFAPGSGANNKVSAIAIQPDNKLVLGGEFTSVAGAARVRVARLNSDGSLDAAFNPGAGANNAVHTVAVQADGKIVVGGTFTTFNGVSCGSIVRLNSDGSLDATFNTGSGVGGVAFPMVSALAIQADGKILVGGYFFAVNGMPRYGIARLHNNGSLDASFDTSVGASTQVYTLAVQPDGRLLLGGVFTFYNNVTADRLMRIHTGDGDADGVEDAADIDGDNDGVLNADDSFPLDPVESVDTDNDGTGNNTDIDDDGDNVPDYIDADALNAAISVERLLPLNDVYRGSVMKESQSLL